MFDDVTLIIAGAAGFSVLTVLLVRRFFPKHPPADKVQRQEGKAPEYRHPTLDRVRLQMIFAGIGLLVLVLGLTASLFY